MVVMAYLELNFGEAETFVKINMFLLEINFSNGEFWLIWSPNRCKDYFPKFGILKDIKTFVFSHFFLLSYRLGRDFSLNTPLNRGTS